jgi:hypothetical protein
MLCVSSACHSVVFPFWLFKFLSCCDRLFTVRCVLVYTVFCNIMIVVPKHVDKNPSEDGHS